MTDVRDTSIESYHFIVERGISGAQRRKVIAFLYGRRPYTRAEISRESGLAINAVCGRVNELIKLKALQEHAARPCNVSGRKAHPVSIKVEAQRELF